jgi:acyl-CoA synthetase
MDHGSDRKDTAVDPPDQYPVPAVGSALVIPAGWLATSTGRSQGALSAGSPGSPQKLLGALAVKWTTKLIKCVDASPLLIQWTSPAPAGAASASGASSIDIVVVGSHGGDVVAAHAGSGEQFWTLQLGEHIEASAAFDPRTGLLFVASFHGQDVDGFQSHRPVLSDQPLDSPSLGCLWAIDAVTGQVRWHFSVEGETKSSPLVVRDHVLIGAYDGHLYQIRCADGALVEKHACGGSMYAAPVLSADSALLTVVTTSGRVSVFSLGAPDSPLSLIQRNEMQVAPMFSTPLSCTLAGKVGLMLAGTDGTLRCVALVGNPDEVWCESVSGTAFFSSACAAETSCAIIGCHDGKLRKISLLDGSVLWECSVGVAIFASPFLVHGGTACVAATVAGDVLVVDVGKGELKSRLRLPAEIFSSPVCREGYLYIGCRDDRLYCIEF